VVPVAVVAVLKVGDGGDVTTSASDRVGASG